MIVIDLKNRGLNKVKNLLSTFSIWKKKRQQKKDMTELNSHTGTLLKESKDIRQEMNHFYKELFSEEEVDLDAQNWLLDQLNMSLDEEEQTSCKAQGVHKYFPDSDAPLRPNF